MKRRLTQLMMGAFALVLAFSSQAMSSDWNQVRGTFERTYEVSGPVNLDLMTHSGDVSLRTGPVSSVHIKGKVQVHFESESERARAEGTLREIQQNPPLEQNGDTIRVGHVNRTKVWDDTSIDYEVVVPPGSNLTARSGSGDVSILGPLETASVETGSGDISVDAVKGKLQLSTGSGDIAMKEAGGGGANVRTGSGDIDCAIPSVGSFDFSAQTGSGDIDAPRGQTVEFAGPARGMWHSRIRGGGLSFMLQTGSGDITIH